MSTRREHPTDTTGAHRAHPVRGQRQRGRSKPYEHAQQPEPATPQERAGDADVPEQQHAEQRAGSRRNAAGRPLTSGTPSPDGTAAGRIGGDGAGAGGFPMERYEPYLDGLFTYCLSVMCEHDAATASLGEALALAERRSERGRAPQEPGLHRPWLYSLVRWSCLRRLSEEREGEASSSRSAPVPGATAELSTVAANQRRRELAALAWPEAAGTAPEQREALELAVRHGLPAHEVAAVLSLAPDVASGLLANAACEVERTRAALAVVKSGGCAAVSRLAGDDQLLLSTGLRRELVRHVDECTECRRVAERAMAGVGWPGTAPAGTSQLVVLEAPRPAVHAAVAAVRRARVQHSPRFARSGFPAQVKDRGVRRDRLRSGAVTTTVVATVLAAPALALWAAYRGAPLTGEPDGSGVAASESEGRQGAGDDPYEQAAQGAGPGNSAGEGDTSERTYASGKVSVGVDSGRGRQRDGHTSSSAPPTGGDRAGSGPGRLTVDAQPSGGDTLITLHASGGRSVRWNAAADAGWLQLSRTRGELNPGQSATIRAVVDHRQEPAGAWSAAVRISPGDSVITLKGRGASSPPPSDTPTESPPPPPSDSPTPTEPPPSSPPPSSDSPSPSPTETGSSPPPS